MLYTIPNELKAQIIAYNKKVKNKYKTAKHFDIPSAVIKRFLKDPTKEVILAFHETDEGKKVILEFYHNIRNIAKTCREYNMPASALYRMLRETGSDTYVTENPNRIELKLEKVLKFAKGRETVTKEDIVNIEGLIEPYIKNPLSFCAVLLTKLKKQGKIERIAQSTFKWVDTSNKVELFFTPKIN